MLVLGLRRRNRTGEMVHEHHALIEAFALGRAEEAAAIMRDQVAASRGMVIVALTAPDAMTAAAALALLPDRPRAIAAHDAVPALLAAHDSPCCPERYVRHLLHAYGSPSTASSPASTTSSPLATAGAR